MNLLSRFLKRVAIIVYRVKLSLPRRSYFIVMRTTKPNMEGHHIELRLPIKAWDSWIALDIARDHATTNLKERAFTMEPYQMTRLD